MESDPFARRLMDQYLHRREGDLERLAAALRNGDFATIKQIGHKLYGSGSAYGFDEISRLGGALEQSADDRKSDRADQLIDELRSFLRGLTVP